MKKMFSQCVKTIIAPTKRLMFVLGVLVFTANLYAKHNYTLTANVASTGTGKVYVSTNEVSVNDISAWDWGESKEAKHEKDKGTTIPASPFYVYVNAEQGYYFSKWTGNATMTGSTNPYIHTSTELQGEQSTSKTATANFDSIVEFPFGNTITLFTDPITGEVLPAKIQIAVNKSTSLTITPNNTAFTVETNSSVSLNGTVGEYVTIQITATTGTAEGDYAAAIKLSPNNSTLNDGYIYEPKDETLNVSILPSPTITFNPPVNPVGGSYTYQQTNIVPKPNPVPVNEVKEIGLLDGNDGVIELVATPATGYRVYRWISTHGGVEEIDYLSGNTKLVNWTKDATVTVEFTEDKYASFFVKEVPTIKYNDLNLALEAAASYSSKTVVVDPSYNNTAKCNGGYLRAGTYTIPDGYTLLVPADDAYTTLGHAQNCTSNEWAADGVTLPTKCYSKLIIEDGTTLNVDGVLCVYAKWNYANSTTTHMKPGNYGWIEMEGNSVININDATLHALGYITNSKSVDITKDNMNQVGRVVANSNAIIYEILVMSDWRGGSALVGSTDKIGQFANLATIYGGGAAGMVKNPSKVFPMNQYYFQNVEVPLTMNPGSKEKVQMTVDAGVIAMATVDFIVPNDAAIADESQIASGLLRLGDNTKLTKYYDKNNDRLCLYLDEYTEGGAHTLPTFFHTIVMNLTVGTSAIPVSSEQYTLPITSNLDLVIGKNLQVDIVSGRDLAFLPGTSMKVDAKSTININSNVYIYDTDERVFHDVTTNTVVNGKGYFSSGNGTLYRLPYRPDGVPAVRTTSNIADSKWDINGNVYVNGALYTTEGGANITSSEGGGCVYFKTIGTKDTTAQGYQSGTVSFYQIPISNAKLYNNDGTFSAGNDALPGQRYIYYTDIDGGKWSLPRAAVSSFTLPTLSVTLPTQSSPYGEIVCVVTKPEGVRDYVKTDFVIENSNPTLFTLGDHSIEGDQLIIPITYNKQDKHSDENITTTLTIKNSNNAAVSLVEKEITVVATEKYKPDFSATTSTLSSTVGTPISTGVNFSLVQENVTTIWNDATYGSRFEWSTSTPAITGNNASEFTFAYGDGDAKLSAAKVTFTPQSEGDKSATLTLTATYTDGSGRPVDTSIDVPLTATATLNSNKLEFALPFPETIYEDSEAFPLFKENSRNNTNAIQFTLIPEGVVNIIGDGTDANPYMVQPLTDGVVELSVSQNASTSVSGIEEGEMKISIQVQSKLLELYPLDLCVDNQDKFSAHTLAAQLVRFDNNAIVFTSNESQTAIWEMQFEGVPQHVTFELSGTNNWLVQQGDKEGENWKNLPISATGAFDGLLLPTTRRLKFTYAMGVGEGNLTALCIDELNLSATTDKVYLPINADGTPSSVEFEFVHTKNLTFNTIDALGVSINTINAGTTEEPYLTTTVTISPNASTELDKSYILTANDGETTKSVVIRTYRFPQILPINLGTDPVERFYFINLLGESNTKHVDWNMESKEIIYQTPEGGIEARYATFAFEGAPHHISFDIDGDVNVSDWVVLERSEGEDFVAVATAPIVNDQTITYELDYSSKYVRIDNVSTNMGEVKLSNFIIEGKPEMFADPEELLFTKDVTELPLILTAVNLNQVRFELTDPVNFAFKQQGNSTELTTLSLNKDTYNGLGYNRYCDIPLNVIWKAQNAVDDGSLIIYDDNADTVMLEVRLLGTSQFITQENSMESGLYTGIPDGYTYHGATYTDYDHHQINLINTFTTDGAALFDYLFIFGETTPADDTDITAPQRGSADGSTNIGSNAITPCYVYKKAEPNAAGKVLGYQFLAMVDNVNTSDKTLVDGIIIKDTATVYIDVQDKLSVYMTGFAPYATTGYSKNDEGVFLFRGEHGDTLDIYLEDCHIFSRNKTQNGNTFYGNKEGGDTFSEGYARGSGGVLVFENTDAQEQLQNFQPFEVNIHTIGDNLLKSNYGCFYILLESMKAYQISAPIHVHLNSAKHVRTTKTTLNFDDIWPTAVDENNVVTDSKRTNGYLGLKKQSNNAPSIDLGNPYTVVNFRGGRIEMQNAQIVSDNYKTTLAISYRSGEYGGDDVGIKLSYGIGTDSVGGTVNFYDGTTTVEPMWVKEGYKQYYLIDTLADGKEWKRNVGTEEKPIYEYRTSCLRTPKNTYVYGGSHCFMRACQHVTSKGGAPKDGPNGKFLGQYIYTLQDGDEKDPITKLATKIQFPLNLTNPNLKDYYDSRSYTYGLESVSPDANNQLHFWIPDGYGGVAAEIDKLMSIWKACMTEIRAGLGGVVEGGVGGDTPIEPNEEVKYFLYCQLDQNIHDVIAQKDANDNYTYKAPVAVPPVAKKYFNNADYTEISPTLVSDSLQYQVLSDTSYTITDKVFYVTTAMADLWQTFTAPFDVEKIWVVETFSEEELKKKGDRSTILREQAKHNADFAAFFAVSMAIGTDGSFEDIYNSYIKWAEDKDIELGLHTEGETYTLRSKQKLVPYFGNNWRDANFYLNHNAGNWILVGEEEYEPKWELLPDTAMNDGILLHQGETYSMMFPYCTGCGDDLNNRDWDYWSGKLLIFESKSAPQTINGRNFLNDTIAGHIFTTPAPDNELIVTGNSTFAQLETVEENVYRYNSGYPALNAEKFERNVAYDDDDNPIPVTTPTRILPTTSFLYGELPNNVKNMPARSISRTGKVNHGKDNTTSDLEQGGIPTVGGDNDMFITAIDGGINIAVAYPQHVRVLSATGAVIYSGMVQTAVDVNLPTDGIYIVSGEREVQKVLY